MTFNALIVNKKDDKTTAQIETIEESQLPQDGDVLVQVEYSTLNYKDGLCLTGSGGLVKTYPHVPGIDFAGIVESSDNSKYKPGDKVILTGWRVGEIWWGGYSQKARVRGEWLVPLPAELSSRHAMAVGTAGLTAMLAIKALKKNGIQKGDEVLVTGAAGGVGSVATALLVANGYKVAAVTGRSQMGQYLKKLGASTIIDRAEIAEIISRPLESERWAGCIDAVGGSMLARILGQMRYGGTVASVGLAGGMKLPATVIPFLLRAVTLMGIDSVMQPYQNRVEAWNEISQTMPKNLLESMINQATLEKLPELGKAILNGEVNGRVVVDVNQ